LPRRFRARTSAASGEVSSSPPEAPGTTGSSSRCCRSISILLRWRSFLSARAIVRSWNASRLTIPACPGARC